jgi:acetolactate synthase-1/3 small subunit
MRISNLIYRRNFNIVSLSVSQTATPEISRFTIMIDGDEWALEQVSKQLGKLVEVISVENLNKSGKFVERWLSLIKVNATMETRPHILQIADVFRCRVVDMGSDALTLEVTGDEGKVSACTDALRAYGILEIAGSGSVALGRSGFRNNGNGLDHLKDGHGEEETYKFKYLLAGARAGAEEGSESFFAGRG